MTTEEKNRRKIAADRHRTKTPPVIALGNDNNDLKEASDEMKLRPKTEEPVIDPAPPVGELVSDQAANDATTNTESADDFVEGTAQTERSPTNEEMALASKADNEEIPKDELEVAVSEWMLAFHDSIENAGTKIKTGATWVLDKVVNGWIKFDNACHEGAARLVGWAYKQNNEFAQQWKRWFPKREIVTPAIFVEGMSLLAEKMDQRLTAMQMEFRSGNTVDKKRVIELIIAVKAGKKAQVSKLVTSLTSCDLLDAKQIAESYA